MLLALVLIAGCGSPDLVEEIPLAPADWVAEVGGVAPVRAPIAVLDSRYPAFGYNAEGERTTEIIEAWLFPTDVIVVLQEGETPLVFLARSPHGGCLLRWDSQTEQFDDPCYGSRFTLDGEYVAGPSPRGMDQLRAEVRGSVVWIQGKIVYGENLE